jgi:hypothetical protein
MPSEHNFKIKGRERLTMNTIAKAGLLLAGCLLFAGATLASAQSAPQAKNAPARHDDDAPSLAQIVALDECDPVTFNAALGADFCKNVAVGFTTTLSDLFAKAAAGTPDPGWDFEPDTVSVKKGAVVIVTDQGGEPHTFTEVAQFGGGFIPVLNAPGEDTVPECPAVFPKSLWPEPASFRGAISASRICQRGSIAFSAAFTPGCA